MLNLRQTATEYTGYGLSVIGVDDKKKARYSWAAYQQQIATPAELDNMLAGAYGIAIIGGSVSGNLEIIDIDSKQDITDGKRLFPNWLQEVNDYSQELAGKLVIESTKNGGYHVLYRCSVIAGNQKLASREATAEEKAENPHAKLQCLIETRGQGGYIVAAPTPGYEVLYNNFGSIPTITPEEREALLIISRSFNEYIEPRKEEYISKADPRQYSTNPFVDYNERGDMQDLLKRYGWAEAYKRGCKQFYVRPGKSLKDGISGDYHEEKKWFTVFTTSTQFEANKAYSPAAVFCLLECGNDWSLCAKKLLELGYGAKRVTLDRKTAGMIGSYRNRGMSNAAIAEAIATDAGLTIEQAGEFVQAYTQNEGDTICTFWANPQGGKLAINRHLLLTFLHDVGGFGLYFYDKGAKTYKIVRNEHGIIEETTTEEIKKYLIDYISSLPNSFDGITRDDLLESIYKGASVYFADSFLEFLPRFDIEFLRDTPEAGFFPFRNGVACVTVEGVELKTYAELKKCIWKSHVIGRNFEPGEYELKHIEFFQFIAAICNNEPLRIKQAIALIGYLSHKYKDPTKAYSVILAEETEDEKKGGGTGKGIFLKALSYLVNNVTIDGKNFKAEKSFCWQRVGLDTHIVSIQDVRKNIDFEAFYSIITEGITIEKKNQDEIYLSYDDAPKVVFTTNYTVNTASNHAKRRVKLIEFSNFYSPERTPLDHFGHRLFDDWDNDQWNRFYYLMFWCLRAYLQSGIPAMEESQTVRRKQIRLNYGEEFLSWFTEYSSNGCQNWNLLNDLYTGFLRVGDFDKKDYASKRFSKALEEAATLFSAGFEKRVNRQSGGKVEVRLQNKITVDSSQENSSSNV
ncbi:MAG: hypothetical protein EOP56_18120 [Sphingobacteriales bacterium]|nr:MAG: hypothetical protein EOP56_18120 [Sphingobacteriales bacterium]